MKGWLESRFSLLSAVVMQRADKIYWWVISGGHFETRDVINSEKIPRVHLGIGVGRTLTLASAPQWSMCLEDLFLLRYHYESWKSGTFIRKAEEGRRDEEKERSR